MSFAGKESGKETVVLRVPFSVLNEGRSGIQRATLSGKLFDINGRHIASVNWVHNTLPTVFSLRQNYPNPFNPETTIRYEMPEDSHISLKIFALNGQLVRTLVDAFSPAGFHIATWDGRDDNGRNVASGVYLYRLVADEGRFYAVQRMALIK